jgi:subtilisin family serine protease
LAAGPILRATRLEPNGRSGILFFLDVYAYGGEGRKSEMRPLLRGVINGHCQFLGAREIIYESDAHNRPLAIQRLNPDLRPAKPPTLLNPPVPAGAANPDCLRIAVLDSGVNYLLPEIMPRLARNARGGLVGRDFWEEDDRPFDYGFPPQSLDPRVSPFSPRHHGTGVASVLLAEVPAQTCLAPYRYLPADAPGGSSDPQRMIAEMAAESVRIINLSSGRERPWPEFRKAIEDHPEMLFVIAAGNDGRDIDARPYYPAAYRLDNVIVVAAANADGQLWVGSNYGAVDIAVPAVDLPAAVADGSVRPLTGTSVAAPRVAALAARLLVVAPKATPAALKRAILERARNSGVEADGIPVLDDKILKTP